MQIGVQNQTLKSQLNVKIRYKYVYILIKIRQIKQTYKLTLGTFFLFHLSAFAKYTITNSHHLYGHISKCYSNRKLFQHFDSTLLDVVLK